MRLSELWRRLTASVRRRRLTAELDEEIAAHRDAIVREYEDDGLTAGEARRRARLRFGGVRQIEEASTDAWTLGWIEHAWRDLRLGARALRRQPVFALSAIATFALGIGAATAIFSVAYGIAFRPLPYPAADRIVRLYEASATTAEPKLQVSQGTFQGWREMVPSLEQVALYGRRNIRYTNEPSPRPLVTMPVTPRFFDVLGVAPALGRGFGADAEYTRFTANEAVLSYEAWQRLFGGDSSVLGLALPIRDRRTDLRIVGVMPRGFALDDPVDLWTQQIVELPIARVVRSWRYDNAIGRLRPDRSLDDLRAELDHASTQLARDHPATNAGWTATVEPLKAALIREFGPASWLFLATVGAVLLVACANVAGLLTARALDRTRETSVRAALGAGRGRLVQLWLAETFLLAAVGAGLGVGLAAGLVRALKTIAPAGLPRVNDIAIDWVTLGVTAGAAITAAVVCGVVPLWTTGSRVLPEGLRAGSARTGDTPRRRRASMSLVGVQSAAALALMIVAIVFARSFSALTAVDLGWQPAPVLSLQVSPRFSNARPWALYVDWADRLTARLEATPGIARAAVTSTIPFSPDTYPAEIARGREPVADEIRWPIGLHIVTDGYFDTMGLTLRRGRTFTTSDRFDPSVLASADPPPAGVAVVTESVARTLWAGQDPVGQVFRVPAQVRMPYLTVVGVVADVRFRSVADEPALNVFLPWSQTPTGGPRLVVRATGDPSTIASEVRTAALTESPNGLVDRVAPEAVLVDRAMAPARVTSQAVAGLGVLALVLASVGVYGSLSTLVAARTRETAVRLALGASAFDMLRATMAMGLQPVAIGAIGGLALAAVLVPATRSLLFGITHVDAASLTIGTTIVLGVAVIACLAPALRAAQTDPAQVLRGD